jgi:hypothetical protein
MHQTRMATVESRGLRYGQLAELSAWSHLGVPCLMFRKSLAIASEARVARSVRAL